ASLAVRLRPWSSVFRPLAPRHAPRRERRRRRALPASLMVYARPPGGALSAARGRRRDQCLPTAPADGRAGLRRARLDPRLGLARREIGRASCRERGEVWGGDGGGRRNTGT